MSLLCIWDDSISKHPPGLHLGCIKFFTIKRCVHFRIQKHFPGENFVVVFVVVVNVNNVHERVEMDD